MLIVVPVSVVLPGAVARIVSTTAAYASTRLSIKALAQHARAADAASRRARSGVFQRQFLLQCDCHLLPAAPLKRNPLGRPQPVKRLGNVTRARANLSKPGL